LSGPETVATYWPKIRTTGYGRAVGLLCRTLFDLEYSPENFEVVAGKLQATIKDKSAPQVYDHFVKETANIKWVLNDSFFEPGTTGALKDGAYPDYYRFTWRMDDLFGIVNEGPIQTLGRLTGMEILSLDHLVKAMNASVESFKATGKLAAFKLGFAYQRDLVVGDPTTHDAELAFNRIRNRKTFWDGVQNNGGAVNALEARPLGDYLVHRLLERASEEDIPVQIHTGYLAGNWGSLAGTRAMNLIPIFDKYRHVRFDIFHASWPWTSELGAIAKNYPNVYPDMCWMWAMNPTEAERTLAEWLDGVPFNKIFGFGADSGLPWMSMGYAIQARRGVACVLEEKIRAGFFSQSTAEEVAAAIMLKNGEQFYRVS
jgi:predicted TIM-barrel fold metal-dependent hydrolase